MTMAQPPNPNGIFLSYAHRDKGFAERLHEQLEAAGIKVFRDVTNLRVGQNWFVQLSAEVMAATRCICIYSPAYFASTYCRWELQMAVRRDPDASQNFILPVRIESVVLPPYAQHIQYIECQTPEQFEPTWRELVAAISGGSPLPRVVSATQPPGAATLETMTSAELRQLLERRFGPIDVKTFCFDLKSEVRELGFVNDRLPLNERIIEILEILQRYHALEKLMGWIARYRRDILDSEGQPL